MPDVLHWLGITKSRGLCRNQISRRFFTPSTRCRAPDSLVDSHTVHNFISMSDMKYNAIVESGIEIVNRVEIPPEMVPKDAQVEIAAKVFHGYHAGAGYAGMDEKRLDGVVGREYTPDPSAQRVA